METVHCVPFWTVFFMGTCFGIGLAVLAWAIAWIRR